MQVPVGPFRYELRLTQQMPIVASESVIGKCDSINQVIEIYRQMPVAKRLSVAWHEIAHAWLIELDPHQADLRDDETVCNIIGLAMCAMTPATMARLHLYLTTGNEARAVMMFPESEHPIPIIDLSDPDGMH